MNRFYRCRAAMCDCGGRDTGATGACEEVAHTHDCSADCGMVLAMAYVLSQPFANLYSAEEGLSRGTLFADLDKPYEGGCCR